MAEQLVGKTVNEVIPEPSLSHVRSKYAEAIRLRKIGSMGGDLGVSRGPEGR